MQVAAIIAAGGRGVRFGADRPKQFLEIGGRSILELSVAALAASDRIQEIVVALPEDHVDAGSKALRASDRPADHRRRRRRPAPGFGGQRVREDRRRTADIILIHDAARPFVTRDVIDRAIDGAKQHGAVIAAMAVRDTVKQAGDAIADGSRLIRATIPRDSVFLAQTPQAFRRDVLARALDEGKGVDATDEAMLVERLGVPVHVVEGDARNIKITTPEDLAAAQRRRTATALSRRLMRIGNGYDLHRLVAGRPLILAGVTIPFELGLDGHSDADIVCHAVTDAILGAAGAGDIGRLFPDTDPKWKGANSIALLEGAVARSARSRLSRVERGCDGDRAEAEAAAVSRGDARESRRGARRRCRRRQRERQDQRRRRQHGPR